MTVERIIAPKHVDIMQAKQAFESGGNITQILKNHSDSPINTSAIIEISYDLQAGSYIEFARRNSDYFADLSAEYAAIVQRYVTPDDILLDIGTGEITNLSFLVRRLSANPSHLFAFDISWSRIFKGMAFARENMGPCFDRFTPFVGDIAEIPLLDKSIDVAVTMHALEPNGGRLAELLSEIFRVTRGAVILFEPCYETNSDEGKKRMDDLGYIKGVDSAIEALGGRLLDKIAIKTVYNPLNPTTAFVIAPPAHNAEAPLRRARGDIFAVPGTDHPLVEQDGFYFSNATGLSFPVLKSIPVLKSSTAILSTALSAD